MTGAELEDLIAGRIAPLDRTSWRNAGDQARAWGDDAALAVPVTRVRIALPALPFPAPTDGRPVPTPPAPRTRRSVLPAGLARLPAALTRPLRRRRGARTA